MGETTRSLRGETLLKESHRALIFGATTVLRSSNSGESSPNMGSTFALSDDDSAAAIACSSVWVFERVGGTGEGGRTKA